jgi:hypothetical protein
MRLPSPLRTWTLLVSGIAVMAGVAQAQDASAPKAVPALGVITIEKIPAQKVLSRNLQGGYDKTQEAFNDLKTVMMQQAATVKPAPQAATAQATAVAADCIGIYPFDPDAVAKSRMEWGAAIMIPDTPAFRNFKVPAPAKRLSVPASEYKVETLPAIEAAVMYSTVGRSAEDGLKFFPWLAETGHVQVGPTRMLYFSDTTIDLLKATPEQIAATKTKIMVPIKKRDRDIKLKKDGKGQ